MGAISMNIQKVKNWLLSTPNCTEATQVRIVIEQDTFEAIKYNDTIANDERLYVLGELPKWYTKNRKKAVLTIDGSDWYIMGWYESDEITVYHPFGKWYGLKIWDVDEAIDLYESKPYTRIPAIIEGV